MRNFKVYARAIDFPFENRDLSKRFFNRFLIKVGKQTSVLQGASDENTHNLRVL